MRRKKVLALVLALCLSMTTVTPASAAGFSSGRSSGFSFSWSSIWDRLFGGLTQTPSEPETGTETSTGSGGTMTLVEDETTVSEDTALRASTYALTAADAGVALLANGDTYTPVSKTYQELYNEYSSTTYYYLYDGTYYKITNVNYRNISGKYLIYSDDYSVYYYLSRGSSSDTVTVYTLSSGGDSGDTTTTLKYFPVTLYNYDDRYNNALHQMECEAAENLSSLTMWNGIYFGGNSHGANVGEYDSYTTGSETITLPYANWNKWTGNFDVSGQNRHGNKTYSGLVESTLNNGSIRFTKMEAGIFTNDTTNKDVYTNVQMPFVYDESTKTYTFDANEDGVYFHTDSTQGTSATPASNSKLYFTDTPQGHDFDAQDKRNKGWFPFNDASSVTTAAGGSADYFFGMQASIPFTMTGNGRLKANDASSTPITFSFSGDDDVWVFIDGKLVLDLGGVHNGMNATLNFADNTWNVSEMQTSINGTNRPAVDVNNAPLSGSIFNEGDTTGTLNQTRETFAATDSHTLTIFYLERGAGSSNCKIQFNLPMKDSVSVKKIANQSMTDSGTTSPLTAEEQTMVNNTTFGFTLYKDGAPVANVNYNLLDINGNYLETRSTDANGHFPLKAGQTAKFIGEIDSVDGNSYYVVEDDNSSFLAPAYAYTANVANGASQTEAATGLTSMVVKATGSSEAEDSIVFTCTNYLDADLPNPTAQPADDEIVIDYGLSVVIDVLKNDVYKGDYTLTSVVTEGDDAPKYGTATIEDGKIKYQLTKQLTGVEVLTYTATASAEGADSVVGTANVYIIPATSMYYEEDFNGLVTFTDVNGTNWTPEGTAQTDPQEPGVVGTVGDSPYGSDAAYLNDSRDSNGSSMYLNTTDGYASFSYSFTGTGTSFFARTGSTAAYMRVVVKDDSGQTVSDTRRNNIYKAVDGTDVTLYNIPVYTIDDLNYGTYTVTVTVMKKMTDSQGNVTRGNEFYLDGIRVIQPLDAADANAGIAQAAYATDGEANMTVATLREKLLGEAGINADGTLSWDGKNFVVFTDSNGAITAAEEYRSNGPKEEVYLNNGQSVTFSLTNWDANTNKIYLGIKAPVGSGAVSINGNTLNINNAADCYYDISGYAQITTDGDGVKTATFKIESTGSLISVTNIKVTGNAEFTIVNGEDINL